MLFDFSARYPLRAVQATCHCDASRSMKLFGEVAGTGSCICTQLYEVMHLISVRRTVWETNIALSFIIGRVGSLWKIVISRILSLILWLTILQIAFKIFFISSSSSKLCLDKLSFRSWFIAEWTNSDFDNQVQTILIFSCDPISGDLRSYLRYGIEYFLVSMPLQLKRNTLSYKQVHSTSIL